MVHHPSFGAAIAVDYAGGTAYTALPQVRDITGPGISRGSTDVTTHDSPDGWREFLPGLPDGGEISFEVSWDPGTATHKQTAGTGFLGDFDSTGCTIPAWQFTLPVCTGTAIWTFDAFYTGAEGAVPVEGELIQSLTAKITGKPSLAVT